MVVHKKRVNEKGSYIFVKWSCANKSNISMKTNYGQLPDYKSHVFSLIYLVDEFSLKEMRMWGLSKISTESRDLGSRGMSRFPCVTPVVKSSSDRVTFRILSNINDGAPLRKQSTDLTR